MEIRSDDERFSYITNDDCPVSDVFYQRAKSAGLGIEGVDHLSNSRQRADFVGRLTKPICEQIGVPYIDTTVTKVHDVTLGKAPAGDFFFCDMLATLYPFPHRSRVLDFGCSTGRVIRNLKAAFPYVEAFGCDPRASSIEFIRPLIPEVNWFVSNESPPMPMDMLPFDMVFAVSVWSHFDEERAIAWFAEMARFVKPNGKLIFSTHGFRSVYHLSKVRSGIKETEAEDIADALAEGRYRFRPAPQADLDSHWGLCFMPRSWPDRILSALWEVEYFGAGLALANQDVYVLNRKG